MKDVTYISIPKGLPTYLAKRDKLRREMAVFFQLKSIYVGGIIHNWGSRDKEIAAAFNFGKSKLRIYVKSLIQQGLAYEDKNKSLVLRSSKFVAKEFGVSTKGFFKVETTHLGHLEQMFKSLAILENLSKQAYELKHKVITKAIYEGVGIVTPTNYSPNHNRKLKKLFGKQFDRDLKKIQQRYTDSISRLEIPRFDLFPYVTLTRQGIADLFGKTSKATGHNYVKKMVAVKLISDQNNNIIVIKKGASYEEYCQLQMTTLDYNYTYQYRKGTIYKVLPNTISFNQSNLL